MSKKGDTRAPLDHLAAITHPPESLPACSGACCKPRDAAPDGTAAVVESHILTSYELLEAMMLRLAAEDSPLAEELRTAMDPLWYALSDADRARLDARDVKLDVRAAAAARLRELEEEIARMASLLAKWGGRATKAEAEVARLRVALTRALCRCTYADCVQHGAYDPAEADWAIEVGNAGTPGTR